MRTKISSYELLKELLKSIPEGSACMEWPRRKTINGYGLIRMGSECSRRTDHVAHRFAYELAVGPVPEGLCVCHRCDNRQCFRPDHLFVGTHLDNALDREAKHRGNQAKGERVNTAKLTASQVLEVRKLADEGHKHTHIARRYSVSNVLVGLIAKRKVWKHI